MTVEASVSYITEAGEALGRIHGTNHLVVIVDDMEMSVRFYRDLLGFKVVRTVAYSGDPRRPLRTPKTYFLDIGSADGMLLGLFQVDRDAAHAGAGPEPALGATIWPGESQGPVNPRKMDHLAFNVATREDLMWFQNHLRFHGIEVSDSRSSYPDFVESIYFYDPSGLPIELACFKPENVNGRPTDPASWSLDTDPVPALRRE